MIITVTDPFCEAFKKTLRTAAAAGNGMPNYRQLNNINGVVASLSDEGLWGEIDALWLAASGTGAASTELFSKYNLKNPGANTLIKTGAPLFDGLKGWKTVDVSNYVSLNFNPFTQGVKCIRASHSTHAWRYDNAFGTGFTVCGETNSSIDTLRFRMSTDGTNARHNVMDVSGDNTPAIAVMATTNGLHSMVRSISGTDTLDMYYQGALRFTLDVSGSSGTRNLPNIALGLGYRNNNGTRSLPDSTTYHSIVCIGSANLTPAKLNTIFSRYMTNIS